MAKNNTTNGWQGGKWIRPLTRLAIYLRDGFECSYCGTDLASAHASTVTLDHLKPRSKGGDNSATNLVTACKSCNSARQDKPWTTFAASPAVVLRIRRRRARNLAPYRAAAREIIS